MLGVPSIFLQSERIFHLLVINILYYNVSRGPEASRQTIAGLRSELKLERMNALRGNSFLELYATWFLTSATGHAALCVPTLCPSVDGPRFRVNTGVRGSLFGMQCLLDDVIVAHTIFIHPLICIGRTYSLSYSKVEVCEVEQNCRKKGIN